METLLPPCDRGVLRNVVWEEGKIVDILNTIYWMKVQILCSSYGKQEAQFANGKFMFFEFVIAQSGTRFAGNVIPVLPNGRILMVLERRGPMAHYPELPKNIILENRREISLGLIGSLEFPGGSIEKGEGIKSGLLRELAEETGLKGKTATLVYRKHPIMIHNATVAIGLIYSVIYLPEGVNYDSYVKNDGGLHIFALTEQEINYNIARGALNCGQATLLGWQFYNMIKDVKMFELLDQEKVIIREEVILL